MLEKSFNASSKILYKSSAAIGAKILSEVYGLNVLRENINDNEGNETRFFVVGKTSSVEFGKHSIILFSLQNQAGALYQVLKIFNDYNCNFCYDRI